MTISPQAYLPKIAIQRVIDWVTIRIRCRLPAPIAGGWTIKLSSDGTERSRTPHRMSIEGSHSSSITIRAPSTSELEISGNLVKWLQGHNLYGTDDLKQLVWAALERLEPILGGDLTAIGLGTPQALSDAIVTRVDCTYMLQLDTPGDVLSWIRSAHATGSACRRGRGVMREGTLVFGDATGRSFARWQIVIYSKGQEIGTHHLPAPMKDDAEVLEWTNRCLRVEVRLGRLELEKKGLRSVCGWNTASTSMMWSEKVGTLTFNDEAKSDNVDLLSLPDYLRGTYAQWKLGSDLRQSMKKAKFYRHRALIRGLTSVDIAVPPATKPTATVVPIKRALEARPVSRPYWADRIDAELAQGGAFILGSAA